jgi:hypothetical protein
VYVNEKMITVITVPGMEGEGLKENDRGGEFNYEYCYNYIVRSFVNVTMYPQHNNF